MTTDNFMAHVEEMPRLRAGRLLDAATAAVARYQPAEWWDRLSARAEGDEAATPSQPVRSPLSINGQRMAVPDVKRALAGALGAGFSEAA